jgi:NADP-dependent 3-hydroxy acid dehydrogenase YdfG
MMSAAQIAEAVAFGLAQPAETTVENITLSSTSGAL